MYLVDKSFYIHENSLNTCMTGFKAIDLSGRRFGRLVVLDRDGTYRNKSGANLPIWVCKCDCGNETKVVSSSLRSGNTKSCGCLHKEIVGKMMHDRFVGVTGPAHPSWKGGYVNPDGYRMLWMNGKRIPEHRFVMEQNLKRKLMQGETVHHKNGNRTDNRIENLELWVTHQPYGQRVDDVVTNAVEMLRRYLPTALREGF